MKRKNIIVVQSVGQEEPRCYGNFKKACEAEGLPYHSLKMKSFPILWGEMEVFKVEFK